MLKEKNTCERLTAKNTTMLYVCENIKFTARKSILLFVYWRTGCTFRKKMTISLFVNEALRKS